MDMKELDRQALKLIRAIVTEEEKPEELTIPPRETWTETQQQAAERISRSAKTGKWTQEEGAQ